MFKIFENKLKSLFFRFLDFPKISTEKISSQISKSIFSNIDQKISTWLDPGESWASPLSNAPKIIANGALTPKLTGLTSGIPKLYNRAQKCHPGRPGSPSLIWPPRQNTRHIIPIPLRKVPAASQKCPGRFKSVPTMPSVCWMYVWQNYARSNNCWKCQALRYDRHDNWQGSDQILSGWNANTPKCFQHLAR